MLHNVENNTLWKSFSLLTLVSDIPVDIESDLVNLFFGVIAVVVDWIYV